MFTQLNPLIPVETDKGKGYAMAVIDYSQEHHLLWVVVLDVDGSIWQVPNPGVRVRDNYSLGRQTHAT